MLSYHYKLLRFLGKKAIDYAVKKANNKYSPYKGKRTYYLRGNTYKKTSNIEAKAAARRFQTNHVKTSYHKYKSMKGLGPYRNVPWVNLVPKTKTKFRHKHKFNNYKLT